MYVFAWEATYEDPSKDEDIIDVLSAYKCHQVVTNDTLGTIVEELAHQELIQKPRYVANSWQPIVKMLFKQRIQRFWTFS